MLISADVVNAIGKQIEPRNLRMSGHEREAFENIIADLTTKELKAQTVITNSDKLDNLVSLYTSGVLGLKEGKEIYKKIQELL